MRGGRSEKNRGVKKKIGEGRGEKEDGERREGSRSERGKRDMGRVEKPGLKEGK